MKPAVTDEEGFGGGEGLPDGWAVAVVADLARADEQPVLTGPFGTNLGTEDFTASGCPVLTIGCLTESGVSLDKSNFVAEEKATELSRYRLGAGDILFSRMASVGRASIVEPHLTGALFNYHIMRLRLATDAFLPELFVAFVRGAPQVRQYLKDANHGATRDGINTSQLLAMPVLVPPLPEQRRIVDKLDVLSERSRRAREALDEVPGLLEKLRQSILAAAFRGDLTAEWRASNPEVEPASELLKRIRVERRKRWEEAELAKMQAKGKAPRDDKWKEKYQEPEPVDASNLPELPEGWVTVPFDVAAGELFTDGDWVESKDQDPSGDVRLIQLADIGDGRYLNKSARFLTSAKASELGCTFLKTGDVLISRMAAPLGRACLFPGDERPAVTVVDVCIARPLSLIDPRWLVRAINSPQFREQISLNASGTTRARISRSNLGALQLSIPPLREQERIIAILDVLWTQIERATEVWKGASASLDEVGPSLLAKAFRGELVPQDPNDEPASVMLARLREERAGTETKTRIRKRKR